MGEQRSGFLDQLLESLNQQTSYTPPLVRRMLDQSFVVVATVIAVATFILSLFFAGSRTDTVLKALSTVAAGITFLLTYLQWRLARQEASFEKYYDRMNTTLGYVDKCGVEEAGSDAQARLCHVRNMRVFNQIDNLEYVLGKYRLGYVSTGIVYRAVRNFKTECDQDWFRTKTLRWIDQIEAYTPDTKAAARYIVAHYQDPL